LPKGSGSFFIFIEPIFYVNENGKKSVNGIGFFYFMLPIAKTGNLVLIQFRNYL